MNRKLYIVCLLIYYMINVNKKTICPNCKTENIKKKMALVKHRIGEKFRDINAILVISDLQRMMASLE